MSILAAGPKPGKGGGLGMRLAAKQSLLKKWLQAILQKIKSREGKIMQLD